MLTEFDRDLLNIVQAHIPLVARPFAAIAGHLGVSEERVIARLDYLASHGYIRRIGAFFDSERLGYVSTLVALQVHPPLINEVAAAINRYSGVTHNYEREGAYNLWFALTTPDKACQDGILAQIAGLPGVIKLLNLPAAKKYKVDVRFTLR